MLYNEISKADTACKLECVKDLEPVQEFVGPVKIILMDMPKGVYARKAWISALIALAQMLMAITTFIVLFYTTEFKTRLAMNLHIVLCTIGYQIFVPSAILMVNSLHGPSTSLKQADRRCQHMFLQVLAISCVVIGSLTVMFSSDFKLTLHSAIGLLTGILSALAALAGPSTYFSSNVGKVGSLSKKIHMIFGMPAFFTSTVCFITGIASSKTFKAWVAFLPDLLYILIGFSVLYTLIILSQPMMKFYGKMP